MWRKNESICVNVSLGDDWRNGGGCSCIVSHGVLLLTRFAIAAFSIAALILFGVYMCIFIYLYRVLSVVVLLLLLLVSEIVLHSVLLLMLLSI